MSGRRWQHDQEGYSLTTECCNVSIPSCLATPFVPEVSIKSPTVKSFPPEDDVQEDDIREDDVRED